MSHLTVTIVTALLLLPWVALAIAARRRFGTGVETKLAVVALAAVVLMLASTLVEALQHGRFFVPSLFLVLEVLAVGFLGIAFLAWVLFGPAKTKVRLEGPMRVGGPTSWGKTTSGRAAVLEAMLLESGRRRRWGCRTRGGGISTVQVFLVAKDRLAELLGKPKSDGQDLPGGR
jgi:hypothetical protein